MPTTPSTTCFLVVLISIFLPSNLLWANSEDPSSRKAIYVSLEYNDAGPFGRKHAWGEVTDKNLDDVYAAYDTEGPSENYLLFRRQLESLAARKIIKVWWNPYKTIGFGSVRDEALAIEGPKEIVDELAHWVGRVLRILEPFTTPRKWDGMAVEMAKMKKQYEDHYGTSDPTAVKELYAEQLAKNKNACGSQLSNHPKKRDLH